MQITDETLRQWILSDAGLYAEAREFGGGGDDEMYDAMPTFIDQNRKRLARYVAARLNLSDYRDDGHCAHGLPDGKCRECA